jgi:hypothetical protein
MYSNLRTASGISPHAHQSCTQMNGAEHPMYPAMTTTVSLTVLILARLHMTTFHGHFYLMPKYSTRPVSDFKLRLGKIEMQLDT